MAKRLMRWMPEPVLAWLERLVVAEVTNRLATDEEAEYLAQRSPDYADRQGIAADRW